MSNKRIKILYRKNLKMSPGKLSAQCVHAALCLHGTHVDMSVVVLGVSDKKFNEVVDKADPLYFLIQDRGYTEVQEGTNTCLAFLEDDPRMEEWVDKP